MDIKKTDIVTSGIDRRTLLKAGLVAFAGLTLPTRALASLSPANRQEKQLSFLNTHTGETLNKVVFWSEGRYIPDSLKNIDYILRDHRAEEVVEMDRGLLDLLHSLNHTLDSAKPFHIISGYRSPHSNQLLRKTGGGGVAKRSLHMQGRAIDIRVPGVSTGDLRKAALSLKAGGVGYYPESRFVHVDTGRVRFW